MLQLLKKVKVHTLYLYMYVHIRYMYMYMYALCGLEKISILVRYNFVKVPVAHSIYGFNKGVDGIKCLDSLSSNNLY